MNADGAPLQLHDKDAVDVGYARDLYELLRAIGSVVHGRRATITWELNAPERGIQRPHPLMDVRRAESYGCPNLPART